MRHWM